MTMPRRASAVAEMRRGRDGLLGIQGRAGGFGVI